MSANQWPDDATLDALLEAAGHTRSGALRVDPEPGGFRVLTADEDTELIEAIRLPEQRYTEDREHLIDERDTARRIGDHDGVDTAEARLEVLAAERRLAQRYSGDLEVDDEERER